MKSISLQTELLLKLEQNHRLSRPEWLLLLTHPSKELSNEVFSRARRLRDRIYGKKIYLRGLIEFTNICQNNCYYCGIRSGNPKVERYRLLPKEILACCRTGRDLGFRTFVLQGGEDPFYTDEILTDLIHKIKQEFPDCAVTLSIGEKSKESYQAYFDAGADRYLLRHETATKEHYQLLHPKELSYENRIRCLFDLKEIGYQTGCGFMVGSPGQNTEHLAEEFLFLQRIQPDMIGIGPFIPHHETPFAKEVKGSVEQTLFLLGLIRLMIPDVLLPATTALGTLHTRGRELGILAGANVLMPNLSPVNNRKQYELYDNKICTGEESAECISCLAQRLHSIGHEISYERGDRIKAL